MTEQKKAFITDALGELEDRFIAEAVEYKKAGFTWKYTKELLTVAACVAVLFVSVSAIRLIPIRRSDEVANGAPEMMQEAVAVESYTTGLTGMPETTPEEENAVMEGNAVTNETAKQENAQDVISNAENLYKPIGTEEKQVEHYSKGIEWREITAAEMDANKDVCGYPTLESIQTSSCVKWMSAEELLALDVDIFMGTVVNMQTYHVTGGMTKYFTVATVEVEDSIRSGLAVGDTCRIYLPFAKVNGLTSTTSIIGDLDKLESGSRAIFMPYQTTEEIGAGSGDVWLSYSDFSDYYFGEGMRFMFLETETGTSYETGVYEVPGGSEASLEDIAEYLREKISE